ncbi:Oidioi.mRNA.OKI2018_I69.PAR.g13129.t1.cds [Oikopleura dioica]|uniref:Oidioi.mRNA.OKI2018_I69.PAR.g13129.t1.cds n=1 Tax=Oikopleura dioica TaxID=34765 RepID=A0ABN7S385_OIKDI|nr:Oidioi.mRNA.OKI2018_I69.PAR.g13129.t1.cds [Oikopleura dioica]
MESPEEIAALHDALSVTESKRIKCALTGHEMVPKRAVIEQHMKGKKFIRLAKEWKKPDAKFEELRAHLVENKKNSKMLYCNLTGRSIQNEVVHIQRHIFGQKFTKALAHFKECEKSGETFRPMRSWGSRGKDVENFYEERGMGEEEEDDGEEGPSKRKRDDDLSDLMPWLREDAASETEEMEAEISGEEEEMDVIEEVAVKEVSKLKLASRKRNKRGSVPVRKKKQQMDID